MKNVLTYAFCLLFSITPFLSFGQTSPCTANTPHFTIDLSGDPNGSITIDPVARDGLCCGAQSPEKCIMATITLDSNAVAIQFEISSGAVPPGALYYQIGCANPTKVGEPICLDGAGPHILTFCKPGNNQNGYTIKSIPRNVVPDSVDVTIGCDVELWTLGYFENSTLEWFDKTSTTGEYLKYLSCTTACDTVTFTPDYDAPLFIDYQVCGELMDTICQDTSSYLCRDIRVKVNSIVDSIDAQTCGNISYILPDGSSADTSGVYVTALQSASGCDSLVYTTLNVLPVYHIFDTIQSCNSAVINGNNYTTTQTVIDSFTSMDGCDSIVETDLSIYYSVEINANETTCDSAQINGNWYFSTQTVIDSFLSQYGCDSVVVTDLTVNNSVTQFLNLTTCNSAVINGNIYTSSQIVKDSFYTSNGCDSIIVTELIINKSTEEQNTLTRCDSAEIAGNWYFQSQLVKDSFFNVFGCDSVVLTELTVNESKQTFNRIESCEGATLRGIWYEQDDVVVDIFQTSLGCDSVVTTTIVINYNILSVNNVSACDSVKVGNDLFYKTEVKEDSFFTIHGCDSVIRTEIEVNYSSSLDMNAAICEGESYVLPHKQRVTQAGTYYSLLQNRAGCDSLVTTTLEVNATGYEHVPDQEKCLGDEIVLEAGYGDDIVSYEWNTGDVGPQLITSRLGDYLLTVTSSNGCISKDTIRVSDANCPACPVYTPSAFTPDHNGINDDFNPVHNCELLEYQFEIYNRWGEKLYESQTPGDVWDGTYMGEAVQQDVYVWLLFYRDKSSLKDIRQSGTVTVIRR